MNTPFRESEFWPKLTRFARGIGRSGMEKVLTLYFTLQDPATPGWARKVILGALAYFVLPLDVLPDILPGIGFTDDFGVIASALAAVAMHIQPAHKEQAAAKLRTWFGE